MHTIAQALQQAESRIDAIDARALLCHVANRSPAYVIAHPEAALSETEQRTYESLVERRHGGEPIAYITGEREFYGRSFKVTPAVLIPRPESELLVDIALEGVPAGASSRVLDLGTGSGCVGLSIAAERPQAKIIAVDQSADALAVARQNALALHVGNVAFVHSEWFAGLRNERFNIIVGNPPYVATGDAHLTQGDLRYEPRQALDGGEDGLNALRQIVGQAINHLEGGGWLILEHGHDQAAAVRELLQAGGYVNLFCARDLAGIERVSGGRKQP